MYRPDSHFANLPQSGKVDQVGARIPNNQSWNGKESQQKISRTSGFSVPQMQELKVRHRVKIHGQREITKFMHWF